MALHEYTLPKTLLFLVPASPWKKRLNSQKKIEQGVLLKLLRAAKLQQMPGNIRSSRNEHLFNPPRSFALAAFHSGMAKRKKISTSFVKNSAVSKYDMFHKITSLPIKCCPLQ
jgi:hypothetical protein